LQTALTDAIALKVKQEFAAKEKARINNEEGTINSNTEEEARLRSDELQSFFVLKSVTSLNSLRPTARRVAAIRRKAEH